MFDTFVKKLADTFAALTVLPGREAQFEMAPPMRAVQTPAHLPADAIASSVLLLLYPVEQQPTIAFIKRSDTGGNHSGQIAFPGGRSELYDYSLQQTALRETQEEVGVSAENVKVIAGLTPLFIPVSNYVVHPFVGYCAQRPAFVVNKSEVDCVIEKEITYFCRPDIRQWTSFRHKTRMIDAPYFAVNGHQLWGATAMIFNEFLQIAIPLLCEHAQTVFTAKAQRR